MHQFFLSICAVCLATTVMACASAPTPAPMVTPTVAPTIIATPTVIRTPTTAPTVAISGVVTVAPDLTSRRIPLALTTNHFSPSSLTARVGQPLRLNLHNSDSLLHEFAIDYSDVAVVVQPGTSQNLDFVITRAGTYTFACNLVLEGDHRSLGMVGTIVVEPSQ